MQVPGATLRRPRRGLLILALVVAAVGLVSAVTRVLAHDKYGIDFDVYRAAGKAVLHGKSLFSPWLEQQMNKPLPYTYPPAAALVAVPFMAVSGVSGYLLWNAFSLLLLFFVVRRAARPLLQRTPHPGLVLLLVVAIAFSLSPVQDEIGFGQVGLVLMAMCFFDCLPDKTRWPRGLLVGIATAVKLVPGLFIPYLWFSGRRRAAVVATGTAIGFSLIGWAVLPGDSHTFWTSGVFNNSRVGDNAYFSNQSLNGMLRRALGGNPNALFLILAALIAIYGLRQAVRAARTGDHLLGIAMTALTGIIVSPVSWIHHLVWLAVVLLVIVGDGSNRKRVALALGLALFFSLRVPYIGDPMPAGWGYAWFAGPLKDSYGLACLVLLFTLPRISASGRAEPRPRTPAVPASS
jgi:alpha-1,2-mannosyltransferase